MGQIIIYVTLIIVLLSMLILPFVSPTMTKKKKKIFEKQLAKLPNNFKISHRYEIPGSIIILFDMENRRISFLRENSIIVANFKEIINYKIDEVSVGTNKLFGDLCSEYTLRILFNNSEYPEISIDLLNKTIFTGNVLKNSNRYKEARERANKLSALFEIVLNKNKLKSKNVELVTKDTKELKDQLNDLKEMVYAGLITESEYEEKRKQILGL